MRDWFHSAIFKQERVQRRAHRRGWIHACALIAAIVIAAGTLSSIVAGGEVSEERFRDKIEPILEDRCFSCHGNGVKKGGVDLDGVLSRPGRLHDRALWLAVLKNVRAGLMPPADKPRPTDEERRLLDDWIKYDAFAIDPSDPDPGRVAVRRLNRIEYHNTIRDLIGVDFDTTAEFPPDDTGHGFDNIGDVLTLSPMLLEKYLAAASAIIGRAVPTVPRTMAEKVIPGQSFRRPGDDKGKPGTNVLSYYEPASVSTTIGVEHDGKYRLILNLTANERYVDGVNDYNRCRVLFRADGDELVRREFMRQEGRAFAFEFDRDWKSGPHELTVEVQPLTPDAKRVRSLSIRIVSVVLRGPADEKYWVPPADHARFFPDPIPDDAAGRRRYARAILGQFAARACRRPVDDEFVDRLTDLAESAWLRQGQPFEAGVARAMTAILASPRFLFREEGIDPGSTGRFPLVDEYALASRLSYFLWSSMPDAELIRLASEHRLRDNLHAQLKRMLADPRSGEFIHHFVGQWLQARDVETVIINAGAVMARDEPVDPEADRRRARFRELFQKPPEKLTDAEKKELQEARASFGRGFRRFREFELTGDLRRAMRAETEMLFEHIIRQDRPLVELLDSDYTFLNERLAKHYGITGVTGDKMRRVELPKGSPRGGVLTQATLLAVTSNPDRTSPVKRGLFILDNILGSPPAPPPPPISPASRKSARTRAGAL